MPACRQESRELDSFTRKLGLLGRKRISACTSQNFECIYFPGIYLRDIPRPQASAQGATVGSMGDAHMARRVWHCFHTVICWRRRRVARALNRAGAAIGWRARGKKKLKRRCLHPPRLPPRLLLASNLCIRRRRQTALCALRQRPLLRATHVEVTDRGTIQMQMLNAGAQPCKSTQTTRLWKC